MEVCSIGLRGMEGYRAQDSTNDMGRGNERTCASRCAVCDKSADKKATATASALVVYIRLEQPRANKNHSPRSHDRRSSRNV